MGARRGLCGLHKAEGRGARPQGGWRSRWRPGHTEPCDLVVFILREMGSHACTLHEAGGGTGMI